MHKGSFANFAGAKCDSISRSSYQTQLDQPRLYQPERYQPRLYQPERASVRF